MAIEIAAIILLAMIVAVLLFAGGYLLKIIAERIKK